MIDWVDALCRDWAHYKRSAPSGLPGQAAFMAAQSSRSGFTQKIPAWMMQPEDISACDRAIRAMRYYVPSGYLCIQWRYLEGKSLRVIAKRLNVKTTYKVRKELTSAHNFIDKELRHLRSIEHLR